MPIPTGFGLIFFQNSLLSGKFNTLTMILIYLRMYARPEKMQILVKMSMKALSNPEGLWQNQNNRNLKEFSIHPQSVIIRFRLLLLCLRLLYTRAVQNNMIEAVLREKLYKAALTWFFHSPRYVVNEADSQQPSWYDPKNREALLEDIQILVAFNKELLVWG